MNSTNICQECTTCKAILRVQASSLSFVHSMTLSWWRCPLSFTFFVMAHSQGSHGSWFKLGAPVSYGRPLQHGHLRIWRSWCLPPPRTLPLLSCHHVGDFLSLLCCLFHLPNYKRWAIQGPVFSLPSILRYTFLWVSWLSIILVASDSQTFTSSQTPLSWLQSGAASHSSTSAPTAVDGSSCHSYCSG